MSECNLSYWNYRFKEITYNDTYTCYELIEVYYDNNNNIISWTEEPVSIFGESLKDIKQTLKFIKQAYNHNTVIMENDFLKDSGHKMIK